MKVIKHMPFALLFAAVLSSCATTSTLRQTKIADFDSTGSPCLDAVLVNIAADGCTSIQQVALDTSSTGLVGIRVQCSEHADESDPSSGWLIHEFYALRPGLHQPPQGTLPLCLDNTMVVLWAERD